MALAYYLHKSRVSIKKAGSTENEKQPEPISLTLKQVRIAKYKEAIEAHLQPDQYLGGAVDNGDCFYDALSKALSEKGVKTTIKELRTEVSRYIEKNEQEIKANIEIGSFENYKKYVGCTHEELIKLKEKDPEAPNAPYRGAVLREGFILCGSYNFDLRIISAVCLEDEIKCDIELKTNRFIKRKNLEDYPEKTSLHKQDEKRIKDRLQQLYSQDEFYSVEDNTYAGETPHKLTCTLALYENHFVPVLTKA